MKARARVLLSLVMLTAAAHGADKEGKTAAEIFQHECAMCHGANGEGVAGIYPRLQGRLAEIGSTSAGREYLAGTILFGMTGQIDVDDVPIIGIMPGFSHYTDEETAQLINFLIGDFGSSAQVVEGITAETVAEVRARKLSPAQVHRLREPALQAEGSGLEDDLSQVQGYIYGPREHYVRHCQGCHRLDGLTDPQVIPPLKNFVGYFTHTPEGRDYLVQVPGVANVMLSDAEVATLLNWVLATYSKDEMAKDFQPYTETEIERLRADVIMTPAKHRAELISELKQRNIIPKAEAVGDRVLLTGF